MVTSDSPLASWVARVAVRKSVSPRNATTRRPREPAAEDPRSSHVGVEVCPSCESHCGKILFTLARKPPRFTSACSPSHSDAGSIYLHGDSDTGDARTLPRDTSLTIPLCGNAACTVHKAWVRIPATSGSAEVRHIDVPDS